MDRRFVLSKGSLARHKRAGAPLDICDALGLAGLESLPLRVRPHGVGARLVGALVDVPDSVGERRVVGPPVLLLAVRRDPLEGPLGAVQVVADGQSEARLLL